MLKVNQMKRVINLVKGMLEENLYEESDPEKRKQIVEYKNQMEELEQQIMFLEFIEQLEAVNMAANEES